MAKEPNAKGDIHEGARARSTPPKSLPTFGHRVTGHNLQAEKDTSNQEGPDYDVKSCSSLL